MEKVDVGEEGESAGRPDTPWGWCGVVVHSPYYLSPPLTSPYPYLPPSPTSPSPPNPIAAPRTVISGFAKHIPMDALRGRMVVLVCNLKPQNMRGG